MSTYISTSLSADRKKVIVWERDGDNRYPVEYDAPYYFFIESPEGKYSSVMDKKLARIDFDNPYKFYEAKKRYTEEGIRLYESDISPELKVLSDKYYGKAIAGSDDLNITFYDIEVDYDPQKGHADSGNPYAPISSVALYHMHTNRAIVLAVPPKTGEWKNATLDDLPDEIKEKGEIVICKNEKELLLRFYQEIDDSDVVSGWNSNLFDDPYVYLRTYKILGENATNLMNFEYAEKDVRVIEIESYGKMEVGVNPVGRIWIDYMQMVKKFDPNERSSYSLEAVALEELDDMEKLDFDKSLYKLYREDFDKFIAYNIQDTAILKGLEEGFKYMNLAIQFSHMVTNHMQSVLGTVATSDTAILNYCKFKAEKRLCLPDANRDVVDDGKKFAGAFVLEPQSGLHEMVGAADIKSLYPSAMRATNISPDTIIGQFFGNENAYYAIHDKTDEELTILYENEMDETKTAAEWHQHIRDNNWLITAHGTIFDQSKEGIIPSILTSWFEERIEMQREKDRYKDLLASVDENSGECTEYKKKASYYDNIQYLKKIQLNSMYGVFGNKYFRFFDIRLAESTTKTGKAILMHMVQKIAEVLDGEYKYPSESIVYGDTDSGYFLTHTDNVEDAKVVADSMNNIINKSYPEFMRNHFNCSNGRENYIVSEREIISDRGIFVKKKHYLLHIVDKDGREVDEMKVMGLQIKKTSIPKFIRTEVTKYFERFLKGEEWKDIKRDIVDFKNKLKDGDILMLGKPTGVNKVEYYTDEFNQGNTVSVGHVKASILYNTCLKKYGDGESMGIRSGMKIRVYNFYKQKKFGKFTAIAVPTDLDILPDWFDHFKKYIDADKQIDILVNKPIKNILDAIDEPVPTAKNVMADDIFAFGV